MVAFRTNIVRTFAIFSFIFTDTPPVHYRHKQAKSLICFIARGPYIRSKKSRKNEEEKNEYMND